MKPNLTQHKRKMDLKRLNRNERARFHQPRAEAEAEAEGDETTRYSNAWLRSARTRNGIGKRKSNG